MPDASSQEQTFFRPWVRLDGTSEHALRMQSVHNLGADSGQSVFEALSTRQTTGNKLTAITRLSNFLDEVDALPPTPRDGQKSKADFAWEMALATQARFHHFAVEDNAAVSKQMAAVVVKFFTVTKGIEDGGLISKKQAIAESLCEKIDFDYERLFPGSGHIPNARASKLLSQLKETDPKLFDSPQFDLIAMRMANRPELVTPFGGTAKTDAKL